MNIAITAHDAKKELMVQFCIAYCGVLSRHKLCATGTTGKMVSEATGLEIQIPLRLTGRRPTDLCKNCVQRNRFAPFLPRSS